MAEDRSTGRRTLADKLNHLFKTVRGRDGEPYSNNEVATAIGVSGTFIGQLRNGKRDNPTKRVIEDLAEVFGVDPAYFFDDSVADQIDARLALLVRLRDAGVTNVAARLVGLSPGSLEAANSMLEQLRALEGLSDQANGTGEANADQ
jgi:transcriptional regulator with XRE-family HTH domain